jgi:hypothetical protein
MGSHYRFTAPRSTRYKLCFPLGKVYRRLGGRVYNPIYIFIKYVASLGKYIWREWDIVFQPFFICDVYTCFGCPAGRNVVQPRPLGLGWCPDDVGEDGRPGGGPVFSQVAFRLYQSEVLHVEKALEHLVELGFCQARVCLICLLSRCLVQLKNEGNRPRPENAVTHVTAERYFGQANCGHIIDSVSQL